MIYIQTHRLLEKNHIKKIQNTPFDVLMLKQVDKTQTGELCCLL